MTMTEAEWEDCSDPAAMVEFVRTRAAKRKLRLFAAACFRRLTHLLPDNRQQQAIELMEEFPEEIESQRGVIQRVRHALPSSEDSFGGKCAGKDDPYFVGLMLYRELVSSSTAHHATFATNGLADPIEEQEKQSHLLRCIFGALPFHDVSIDPAWLTPSVLTLARTIYEERSFDQLPNLAKNLVDVGCGDATILDHCRHVGSHARGCWVLDLLLGASWECETKP